VTTPEGTRLLAEKSLAITISPDFPAQFPTEVLLGQELYRPAQCLGEERFMISEQKKRDLASLKAH
jgi:hypothetical protein